jgi:ATP-dependent RNA helicase DeaD
VRKGKSTLRRVDTKPKPTFAALGLSPAILKAVEALGFEEPAPIQAMAIPVILEGHDVVGQSQTGSGKTAAFAIPAIEKTDATNRAVQVLILCPTRELATQVAEEVHKLSIHKRGVHAVPIYGGASYDRQLFELKKGVQIVIGTPGRLLDHIERGTLKLGQVRLVILDEADRMLDMGFRDDIAKILDATPTERQTVFFSATMPPAIRELIKRYSRAPKTLRIEQKAVTVPTVEQWFYEVPYNHKVEALLRLIDYHAFKLGIIFCNTQRMVDELTDTLLAQGFSADRLHGGIPQAQRTRVMNKFKLAEFEFLVATDVAARGIDVDDLEVVVNYDLPYDSEDYVHRIGRTGRAGKRGMAMTFVSGRDIYKLSFIEQFTRTRIRRGRMPTTGEVHEKRTDVLIQKVRTLLGGTAFAVHTPLVDRLLEEGFSSTDIACALFQMVTGAGNEPEPVGVPKPGAVTAQKAAPRPPPISPIPDDAPPRRTPSSAAPRVVPRPAPRATAPSVAPRVTPGPTPRAAAPGVAPRVTPGPAPRVTSSATPRPAPIVPRHPAPAPSPDAEPMPLLRLAPRGSQWVRLSIGWRDQTSPRAIVNLLGTALGAPAPRVGMIEVAQTQAFAQVATEFLNVLENGPLKVTAESGPALIELLPPKHRSDIKAKTYTKHKTP